MTCPRCCAQMREGYIPTPSIEWIPKFGSPHLIYKKDKSNGFRIGKHAFTNHKKQPADYCAVCNILILDCSITQVERFHTFGG